MMQPAEVTIVGTVVPGGIECPLFRTEYGRTFALQGVGHGAAPPGTRMRPRGQVTAISFCQQGPAFAVAERLA